MTSAKIINDLKGGENVTVEDDAQLDGEIDEAGNVNPDREMQLENVGEVNLTLNGTLTSGNLTGNTWGCMRIMPGTKLTVTAGENGKFTNTKSQSAINVCGGEVVVNGGCIESAGWCFVVYTDSDEANADGSTLTINGGTFKSNWDIINVVPGMNATVVINGGKFYGWNPSAYVDENHKVVETEEDGVKVYTVVAK